jgi:hypothetical protein
LKLIVENLTPDAGLEANTMDPTKP